MEKKKPWKKYMNELHPEFELVEVYRKLRLAFQREGWTQKELERPPYYPTDIMQNFQKFSGLKNDLIRELKSYFGTIDHNEFDNYLMDKLKQIDLEIPLKDGNIKRDNSRDEDY
jgi:hypothetical protein